MAMPSINDFGQTDSNAGSLGSRMDESSNHTLGYYYNNTNNIYLASIPQ